MQLSNLLARLTPEERSVLLERRLGANAVALDNQALTSHLVQPASLALALAELNFGQLLLLRWLGTRPNLEATWSELLEALGDRLTPELRDVYLKDLRIWGLADHHPTERGGWFGTYPAVIAHLPSRGTLKLRAKLEEMTTDLVARIASALGQKNPPTRKDGRIATIMSVVAEPEPCRQAVERLSPEARELFAWVRERGGSASVQELHQRAPVRRDIHSGYYGSGGLDRFWRPLARGEKLDPTSELVRCALLMPYSPYAGGWYGPTAFMIPEEVELAYSGRTLLDAGPMQPPPLEEAEPLTGPAPNPAGVLRDVIHLLGFMAAGRFEWRQDGEPYKRSLVALGKVLGSPGAEYPEMLWGLAVGASLVQPVRHGLGGYFPVDSIDASPRDLFAGLLVGWARSGARSVEVGESPGRAQEARVHLLQLLQIMPPDTSLHRRSIDAWLRFHWPVLFSPEFQPHYATAPEPGFESLGSLLLVRGSTSDGQEAMMLPAAHQQLLDRAIGEPLDHDRDAATSVLPPWDDTWIVQPDRSIVAPPNASPEALLDLWKVAQLESNQGASLFRVTSDSIAAALNRSMTVDEIRELLKQRSRVPLPPTVERLIDDQGQKYGRIRVGSAQTYVKVDDPALLAELRRDKRLQKLDWHDVAPGVAFVVSSDPASVIDTLRKAGYLPVPDQQPRQLAPVPTPRAVRNVPSRKRKTPSSTDVLSLARTAIREDRLLYVTWMDGGDMREGELEIIDLHGREIHANNLEDGEEVLFFADDVIEAELGDEEDLSWLGSDDE